MQRTKYNVNKDVQERTCDGIIFDSKLEMRYYSDVVRPGFESGDIIHYELQKEYELQPKFERAGKTVRPITYVADFYIEYADGRVEVIDTKGMPDSVAQLKRKLFWYKYPDIDFHWVSYVKKFGGWKDYEELQALRREAKRTRTQGENNNGKD